MRTRKLNFRRHKIILVTIFALLSIQLESAEPTLLQFELEDYERITYTNEIWPEQSIVMFLSNKNGTKYNEDYVWTSPLVSYLREHEFGSKTVFVSIADVTGTPRLARGFIRRMFEPQERNPVGLTLLDWHGVFFKAYDLYEDGYHFLIFDSDHRLIYKDYLQEFNTEKLGALLRHLDDAIL